MGRIHEYKCRCYERRSGYRRRDELKVSDKQMPQTTARLGSRKIQTISSGGGHEFASCCLAVGYANMKARCYIPLVLITTIQLVGHRLAAQSAPKGKEHLELIRRAVAQRDESARIGDAYPNPRWVLPAPTSVLTNKDGTLDVRHVFFAPPLPPEWPKDGHLTNGFTLHISNSIVIAKSYSRISLQ